MILQSTYNANDTHTDDHSHDNDYNHNGVSTDDCLVDTEAFNQLLQCCFDPSHLDSSNLTKTRTLSTNSFNSLDANNLDNNLELINSNKSEISSTIENSSLHSNNSPYISSNFLDSCTPIDLNPCCVTENHLNNDEVLTSHIHDQTQTQNEMDLSEMIILNNFFTACCDDSNVQSDSNVPDTCHPISNLPLPPYSKRFSHNNNTSSIRESLKANQIDNSKGSHQHQHHHHPYPHPHQHPHTLHQHPHPHHHHHLLHLHHHNRNDYTKSHTHDIIYHHHNGNTCSHDHKNHINHHHHLHFEDKINGQKIKHDFILPDCDIIPKNLSLNPNSTPNLNSAVDSESNINLNNDKSVIKSDKCTDFITSSICKNEKKNVKPALSKCNHLQNIRLPTQKEILSQPHSHSQHKCNSNILLYQKQLPETTSLDTIKIERNDTDENYTTSSNDSNNLFKCRWNNCNEELDPFELEKHVFEHHLQNLPLTPFHQSRSDLNLNCEWYNCDFLASNVDNFLKHMPTHTHLNKEDSKNINNIANHHKVADKNDGDDNDDNNNEKTHRCKWVDPKTGVRCDEIFSKTDQLTDHLIEKHIKSGKSSYLCHWEDCNRCGKPFTQKQKIIRHLNTHTNHRPFECEICHKKFSLDLMLKQHMRIHTGEKPYKCKQCGKTFKTSSSLTIHLRTHSGDKPMECKICGKRFNESSNLNKHMKIHFRQFKCQHCLKSFDSQVKFDRHQALCRNKPLGINISLKKEHS